MECDGGADSKRGGKMKNSSIITAVAVCQGIQVVPLRHIASPENHESWKGRGKKKKKACR